MLWVKTTPTGPVPSDFASESLAPLARHEKRASRAKFEVQFAFASFWRVLRGLPSWPRVGARAEGVWGSVRNGFPGRNGVLGPVQNAAPSPSDRRRSGLQRGGGERVLCSADSLPLTARGSGRRPDEWASGTQGMKSPECHLLSE